MIGKIINFADGSKMHLPSPSLFAMFTRALAVVLIVSIGVLAFYWSSL